MRNRDVKICLVNPGRFSQGLPPLSLGYLCSYLRKYGEYKCDIQIVDENAGHDVLKVIRRLKPNIVGISATTPTIQRAGQIAASAKEMDKDIITVVGGKHVTFLPQQTLEGFNFDIGVIREGEETFRELVAHYVNSRNGQWLEGLKKIDGIAFKHNGSVIINKERALIKDIDMIPFPARDLFDMGFYLRPRQVIRGISKRATNAMTSRGCPYHCVYCSSPLFWQNVRFHSVKYVISEIKELVEKYKVEALFFHDDILIVNKKRLEEICNGLISEGLSGKLIWSCHVRANLLSEKDMALLKLMKEAGCVQLDFGFESGSDRMLKFLKKSSVTVAQNQLATDVAKMAGLRVYGNFMLGTEGETKEDLLQTKDFITQNLDKIDFYSVRLTTPYPGTELWDLCEKKNLLGNVRWEELDTVTTPFLTTNSRKNVLDMLNFLDFLASKKISSGEKMKWLLTRIKDNPKYTFQIATSYLKNRFKFALKLWK